MNSKVKVTADDAGNVIIPSQSNPEWGYIRIMQIHKSFNNNGFITRKEVTCLIKGIIPELKELNWKDGQELEGKIIIKESFVPFNTKEPERDYKIAGKTGIVCCQDGQPIYRKAIYTIVENAVDDLIEHNNGDAIRDANAILKKTVTTTETSDFAL